MYDRGLTVTSCRQKPTYTACTRVLDHFTWIPGCIPLHGTVLKILSVYNVRIPSFSQLRKVGGRIVYYVLQRVGIHGTNRGV